MSHPFQPLGFSLHGVQVNPHREEQSDMSKTQSVCDRLLAAMQAAGGMLTSAQVREELRDVRDSVRYAAINKLVADGIIAGEGNTTLRVYSLVRPGTQLLVAPTPAEVEAPAPMLATARTGITLVKAEVFAPPSPGNGVVSAAPAPLTTQACGLRDRLDAIADDLQDALEDACGAQLAHSLLTHLVAAGGELRKARKALAV